MLESFPKELQLEILSYLSHADLLQISKTCRSDSRLVKPSLFSVLNFSGTPQTDWEEHHINGKITPHRGRKNFVNRANVEDAVSQVIELGIAPLVKTFKFSPTLLVHDSWATHPRWVEQRGSRAIHSDNMERGSGGSNWIDEEHDNTVRSEHIAGSSQSRLGRMHEKDENNEPICHDNPVFQQTNFRLNETALRELVERMSLLRRVEIGACDVHRQRLETHDSDSIVTGKKPVKMRLNEILSSNLELLAAALHSAGRCIEELWISPLNPSTVAATPAVLHIFTGLTNLHLGFNPVDAFLLGAPQVLRDLPTLLKFAQPTLKRLSLTFHCRPFQTVREHTLSNLLCELRTNIDDSSMPLIFPRLHELRLTSVRINGPSLSQFLHVQSSLRTVHFKFVDLATPNWSWSDIASGFPPSLQTWYVSHCKHQHHRTLNFRPYQEPLSPSCGWETKDPFNENDTDPYLYINSSKGMYWRMRNRDPDSHPMTWRIRDEVLTENHKRSLNIAAFVRAGTARIGEEISEAERERQDRELEKKDPRVRDCIVSDANSGVKYGSGKIATCLTEEEMGVWESWEQTRQMTATSDWTVH